MASDGLASTAMGSPPCFKSIEPHERIVFKFCNYNFFQLSVQVPHKVSRQVVCHGRAAVIFSISSAIALASKIPTQIGITASNPTSFNTTIGV